jgi:hypothetical protein
MFPLSGPRLRLFSTLMSDDFGTSRFALLCVSSASFGASDGILLRKTRRHFLFRNLAAAAGSLLRDVGIAREHQQMLKNTLLSVQHSSKHAAVASDSNGAVLSPLHVVHQVGSFAP